MLKAIRINIFYANNPDIGNRELAGFNLVRKLLILILPTGKTISIKSLTLTINFQEQNKPIKDIIMLLLTPTVRNDSDITEEMLLVFISSFFYRFISFLSYFLEIPNI